MGCAQLRQTGEIAPHEQGGGRRSHRIEAQAVFISGRITAKQDMTLTELQAELLAHGGGQHRRAVAILSPPPDDAEKVGATRPGKSVPTLSLNASAGVT